MEYDGGVVVVFVGVLVGDKATAEGKGDRNVAVGVLAAVPAW